MTISPQETSSGSESRSYPESPETTGTGEPTTGIHGQTLSFTLLGEPDPVRPARKVIPQIQNTSVLEQVDTLLSTLRNILTAIQRVRGDLDHIPPLRASLAEGDSVLIEWVFPDFRVGFNIEPNPENSGWHLVSNKNLDELTMSGRLRDVQEVVASLVDFILANV
jgi:hypothetical protein